MARGSPGAYEIVTSLASALDSHMATLGVSINDEIRNALGVSEGPDDNQRTLIKVVLNWADELKAKLPTQC